MAGQLTFTNGPVRQGDKPWIMRAMMSLPVPLSPWIRTGTFALATLCGRYLAQRVAGAGSEAGPLLSRPLPRFPLPALRRWYQRAAYAWYGLKDEWL